MRVLVTGANGFVGRALVERLRSKVGYEVSAAVRSPSARQVDGVTYHAVGDVCASTDWLSALDGVGAVVHLAARAHVLNDNDPDTASLLFRQVNVDGALELAKQALAAGVKRFIFVSSIGVNGNSNALPFSESSPVRPHALYAASKYEAERALTGLLKGSSMELVIIRPPLVYDADAPGNFKRLLSIVGKGLPLPFGLVHNSRSMISRSNLAELLEICIDHPAAANELFLVADGDDLSTAEIVKHIAEGMGRRARLIPMPKVLLWLLFLSIGRKGMYVQLCESLRIDTSKVRSRLGWTPAVSARQQLQDVGKAFQARR